MHDRWQDQLPYYAAGTLDPAERAALEAHLSGCEACRAALETWAMIAGAVREDAAARVEALPPLHLPDVFSRNGHAQDAPSLDGVPRKPEQTENTDMTVHFPEIANLRPAPQSRSLLTLAAAVLLVVLFGVGAILLAQRIGDPSTQEPGAPQGDQPAAPGIQAGTPTIPATSPTAEHLNAPQMTSTALIEQYQETQAALPEELQVLPPHMTSTAFIEQYRETQAALPEELQVLPPTVVPPTATPVMPGFGPMTPGMSSSITSVPLDLGLPPRAEIEGVRFEAQTWNNSGPAALSMALSALGWEGDQAEAAEWLRADADDRSIMLWEMVYFVEQETEFGALHREGGVPALLKRLVAYGFPVVIPVGLELDGEWYGHHWVVTGYDDEAQAFLVYDSYLGAGEDGPREVSYDELDDAWRQFNRAFLIVYRPEDRAEALDELAHYADPAAGYQAALLLAGEDAGEDADAWTMFNVGAAWVAMGDPFSAAEAFDRAFDLGLPWRVLWYRPEAYAAYFGAGSLEGSVMRLADEQSQAGFFEEVAYWRGMVYAAQQLPDLARREFESVLDFNPNYLPARVALDQVTLVELGAPVYPVSLGPSVYGLTYYSIVSPQAVPPTPYVSGEWSVEITPGAGEGPFLEVTQVPMEPTGTPLPPQEIEPTATPIPAN